MIKHLLSVNQLTREDVLRIMQDPRAGAFGVTAIVGLLLLKWSALASIGALDVGVALLVACALGRAAMLLALLVPPTGQDFYLRAFVLAQAIAGGAVILAVALVAMRRRLPARRLDLTAP